MAIAIGAQSCSTNNKSETESAAISPSQKIHRLLDTTDTSDVIKDFNYLYSCASDDGNFTLDNSDLADLKRFYNLTTGVVESETDPGNVSYSYYPSGLYVFYDGSIVLTSRIIINFYYKELIDDFWWQPNLKSIQFRVPNGWYTAVTDTTTDYSTTTRTFAVGVNFRLLGTEFRLEHPFVPLFYDETEINPVSFTFNNQINYNATYNADISQPFVAIGSTAESTQTTIDIGWFWSGGKLWDGIKVYWINAYASSFMMESGELYQVGSNVNIYSYYLMMEYRNSITGEGVVVNKRNTTPYDNNGGLSYYVERSSTWVSSNYQTITLISDTSEINITNLNKYNNTTAGGSITTGGNIGLSSGFTLLGSAFSSILPFLAIQVLPGLSIGLLLFIPLIVIIIVLVFKVVKK